MDTTNTAPKAAKCPAYRTGTSWIIWERGTDKCSCGRELKLRKHPVREGEYPEVTYPAHRSGGK